MTRYLQKECDPDNPREHAAWALTSFPVTGDGTPMVLPLPSLQFVSEHLWRCGFRHHPELQEIRQEQDPNVSLPGAGIKWVANDDENLVPEAVDLSGLTPEQVEAVRRAVERYDAGQG